MSHTRHRNISSAIINLNCLEQSALRDFVNSGPSSATVQGLKGSTNIKTRLELSTALRTCLTALPHSPSLELLLKCCRLEFLEKSIQNFGEVLLLSKQLISLPLAFPFHMEHTEKGAGISWPDSHSTITVPSLLWGTPRYNQEYGIIQQGKNSLVMLPNSLCWYEKSGVFPTEFGVIE